jgi:membrane protein YqaA with SNARE-associated domain
MKTWLKGGLIGGLSGFIIGIVLESFLLKSECFNYSPNQVMATGCTPPLSTLIFILFSLIILSSIIGALIGWIYGKVKRK